MTGMNRQDHYSGNEAAEELKLVSCWMPPYTRKEAQVFGYSEKERALSHNWFSEGRHVL